MEDMLTNLGGFCIALSAVSTASTADRTVHTGGSVMPKKSCEHDVGAGEQLSQFDCSLSLIPQRADSKEM